MRKPAVANTARRAPWGRWRSWLMALLLALATSQSRGDDSSLPKYQVEAVFLYNFAKYVDWPAAAFSDASSPITIGILGADPFGDNLQHIVAGKVIKGRTFVIRHLDADADARGCQILFVSDAKAPEFAKILSQAAALPILTVGEDEPASPGNEVIDFVLKEEKIRLEIDLTAARKAGLTISSKLLAVADTVKGKAK